MDEERLAVFLDSLMPDPDPLQEEMEQRARKEHIPILRPASARFLAAMTASVRPRRVLELGTAIGYSALCMASELPEDGWILTAEKAEDRAADAREYIRRAGYEQKINVVCADGANVLKDLVEHGETFDLIFLDAAKGQYPRMLPDILMVLGYGGMLITDNIFQEGTLLESRFAVPRRDRTIHARMREYLRDLTSRDGLVTSIIPVGDGMAVTVKRCT